MSNEMKLGEMSLIQAENERIQKLGAVIEVAAELLPTGCSVVLTLECGCAEVELIYPDEWGEEGPAEYVDEPLGDRIEGLIKWAMERAAGDEDANSSETE